MKNEKVRKRLVSLMTKHCLSAKQVATLLNRHPGTVRNWRCSRPDIPIHQLELLELKAAKPEANDA